MQEVTVYATAMQAVRRTADNCRRMLALLDAFGVAVSVLLVDSLEMRTFVQELLAKQDAIGWREQNGGGMTPTFQLPLCFVGPVLVGTYDEVVELNEAGTLPESLRVAGYGGVFRAAVHNGLPVGNAAALAAAAASQPVSGGGGDNGDAEDGNGDTRAAGADVVNDNTNGSTEDGAEDESLPPPPPPEEDDLNDGVDSALHSSSLDADDDFEIIDADDDDDDEPPPPPPDDDDEEEVFDEDELPPPSPPPED